MSDGGGFTILEVEWTPLTHDELRLRRSGGVRRNTARTRNVLVKLKGMSSRMLESQIRRYIRRCILSKVGAFGNYDGVPWQLDHISGLPIDQAGKKSDVFFCVWSKKIWLKLTNTG